MISRKYRISADKFPEVTRGKTSQNDLVRVVFVKSEGLKNPKFAVIVPGKIAKTSVSRNLIRRQVYQIVASLVEQVPIGYFSIYPKKAESEYAKLDSALREILCSKK